MKLKTVVIIGSTGSIGRQTIQALKKINALEKRFEIIGIAANKSELFIEQLHRLNLQGYVFGRKIPDCSVQYFDDVGKMIEALHPDYCVIASGGSQTLRFTMSAVKHSSRVCLANKESLVMAGSAIKDSAKKHHTQIIPVDSEHSSVFQLVQGECLEDIEKIVITASGGALRDWPLEKQQNASVEDVLKHPNWEMGPKITVDSATLFNKGLEVIEASEFFDIEKERIQTAFCYSSYIHALVLFKDGSIKLHAGKPNMVIPIAYSLTYPRRLLRDANVVLDMNKLALKPMELNKYPAVEMAYEVLEGHNSKRITYNA
ncbi:MAG: 1-deoxy-D-xylulose-5-phosphate reductoisomerase, partial [Thermotogota bacterium]